MLLPLILDQVLNTKVILTQKHVNKIKAETAKKAE